MIEVMVAVLILSTAIVAVLHSFQTGIAALGAAGERLRADVMLREIFADLEEHARPADEPLVSLHDAHQQDDVVWTVDWISIGASSQHDLYRADVSLWWEEGGYREYNVSLYISLKRRP